MTIKELMDTIHIDNIERGWWDGVDLPLDASREIAVLIATSKLMLTVSELSEALEEIRDGKSFRMEFLDDAGKPLGFPSELADAVIRILDLAYACGIENFEEVITKKLAYNRTRGHRHGGRKL